MSIVLSIIFESATIEGMPKHSILELAFNDVMSWVLRVAMVGNLIYVLYHGDYVFAMANLTAIFLSCAPMVIKRTYRISLPWEVDFLITLALFLHVVLGEVLKFYDLYPFWDKFMHILGTATIGILGFMAVYALHFTGKIDLSLSFICLFTIIFSMAVGSLWEIGEFIIDQILGRNTQYSLYNTMWDLINNTISGAIVGVGGMFYIRYLESHSRARFHRTVREMLGMLRGKKREKH
ncbi:MAG TPA: hypothetical protein VJL87_00800 [Bdellovibrionota bacterium]|nr:hypothetical protein [Bdellovibrionota bacterium]